MILYERRQKIIELLEEKKSSSVRDLARLLYTSEASVRRDIEVLSEQGLVQKTYGGVVRAKYTNGVVPLELRDSENSAAKEEIAERAAALIHDGNTVIMDASSTVRRIIKYVKNRKNLKIITNNLQIFSECEGCGIQLYCTGGTYSPKNRAFIGHGAERYVNSVFADCVFFSSQGIDENGSISDSSEEESAIRLAMFKRAKRQYFLCDSSKLGVKKTFFLCSKEDITGVICNTKLPWD